jgi:hypothetical protein
MATRKNISANQTPSSNSRAPKGSENEYALLRKLFSLGSNEANADLTRIAKEGPVQQARMLSMIGGLKCSPVYQSAVADYSPIIGEYALLKLCGEMYMAGKTSVNRYDPESLTS